ncbi:MAG: HEAT repeat domain-containing protein [Planctomycetes bacterium]|nr:HEAT repeat domain-containing protein [Planctomycetota bacterium]
MSFVGGGALLTGALAFALWPVAEPKTQPLPVNMLPAPVQNQGPAHAGSPSPAPQGGSAPYNPSGTSPAAPAEAESKKEEQPVLPRELHMPVGTPEEAITRIEKLIEILNTSTSLAERTEAVQVLVALGDKAAPRLPGLLKSCSSVAVVFLADAAVQLKVRAAAQPLIERLDKEAPHVQIRLLDAIGRIGGPETGPFVRVRLAQTKDPALREAVWLALSRVVTPEDLELAFAALGSDNAVDQRGAANVVAALDADENLRPKIRELFEKTAREKNGPALLPYLEALVQMPGQSDNLLLTEALLSPDARLRRMGVEGISQSPLTIDRLSTVLQGESDPGVQFACLRVLVDRPQLLLVPKAVQLLDSRDYAVRGLAHKFLVETYGRNLGPYTGVWKSWLEQGAREKDHLRKTVFEAHQTLRIKERQEAQAEADSALSLVKR